jgi:hypothetical protein
MLKIEHTTGLVIADDLKASIKAIDDALLQESRLTGSLLEKLVSGRADMLSVVRQVNTIRSQSNLQVVGFGCPGEETPEAPAMTERREPVPVC